jgi:5-methylcytosine-specific restriction endonuclease McrA
MPTGGSLGRAWRRLRAEVLARNSVCYLCGHSIDQSLHWNDPMGATVDHVIPRRVAPHLALDPTNVRPAHRRCNSRKNDQLRPENMPWSEAW